VTGTSARAQVRRREEQEPGGEPVDVACPYDADFPGLEGLSERFPGIPPELGELVQEKDPTVREGDLSRAGRVSATDEPGGGHGMMSGAKRAPRHEARPGGLPHGAVDLRRLERFVFLEVGQDSRDHLNLIFPTYFNLMTRFPAVHPAEDAGAVILH
jgi:hypothetical protein